MVASDGNAPTSSVFQTDANLSQLQSHNMVAVTGIEPAIVWL